MANDGLTERVLIVAPVGRDAAAIAGILNGNGHRAEVCSGADAAAAQTLLGAGAVVLTEEALERDHIPVLMTQLAAQPAWSELPVIILTAGGEIRSAQLLDLAAKAAGSITLLERPLATATLLRTIEVALRSRRRQYQVRELLESQRAREAALREADRRKDTFLAILSHELRNPLAPIRNAAELLGSSKLTPLQLRWAQGVIRRQTGAMASLLDDLLDLARVTQGKLRLRKQSCSLRSVIDAAVESARPILDNKRHELTTHVPDNAPLLNADPLRLAQAISNLLTNAAKYTDSGGRVELSAHVGDAIEIRVRDNGIGIPQEHLGRVFTMFSQISDSAPGGGLGIGLALVKGFVELHGGRVSVQSAGTGKGSEFVIQLPLTPATAAATPAPLKIESAASPSGKLRVLIVDDNKDAADTLALLLSLDGHEVRAAYSGHDALSLAQTFRPDVALLDIGMPQLDGYATGSAMRRQRGGMEICLIALTGLGQENDKRRSREAGFAMHLTKPVDPGQLRTVLQRLRQGEPLAAKE